MSQGIKIIMLIAAGLIAIGLIIFYIVPRAPAVVPVTSALSSEVAPSPRLNPAKQGSTLPEKTIPVPASPISDADTTEASLSAVARSFAERYGTFSTDAAFSNITDLYSVMSQVMLMRSQAYVQKTQTRPSFAPQNLGGQTPRKATDPLTMTTTTVLSVQVYDVPFGATTASAVVKTQRTQIKGSDAPKTWYQDLSLIFVKEDGTWKVDSAVWK